MDINVICIGDELLSGDTLNTNLLYVGEKLACNGLRLQQEICVPDDEEHIMKALEKSANADVVLMIGGLGPTRDDMTRPVTARFLGRRLIMDPQIRDGIADYLGQRARKMPLEAMEIQAEVPEGATVLANHNGTAPGLMMDASCSGRSTTYVLMPGPPKEMRPMFDEQVLPVIMKKGTPEWIEKSLRIVGVGESIVESTVRSALGDKADCYHLAYCIKADHVLVRIAKHTRDTSLDLDAAYAELCKAFGFHRIPDELPNSAAYLGFILKDKKLVLSTAESCTGGGIAAAITDIPGSSEWFAGAFVTYSNQWKQRQLGVSEKTLQTSGAVSQETVSEMLCGLLANGGADLGIAVSGIAGPGGGTAEKPVGTVVIGIAGKGWKEIQTVHFNGLRDTVRSRTASTAIAMLINKLLEGEKTQSR